MGIFSWFTTTATKSLAAAEVQSALEALSKNGLFEGNSASLANRVVDGAFTRLPQLAKASYNKHILAVVCLTMVSALPSFTRDERDACKQGLGILLNHVLELVMSNSLALTMSEQGVLEKAQMTFIADMQSSAEINLGG